MKKMLLTWLLFLVSCALVAQSLSRVIISNEGSVLESVQVYNVTLQNQTLSDELGYFSIKALANDTLVFSLLGYERLVTVVEQVGDTIILQQSDYYLNEFQVEGKKERLILKGINDRKPTKPIEPMTFTKGNDLMDREGLIKTAGVNYTLNGPFTYFLKEEKEKRKLKKYKANSKKLLSFNELIMDEETKTLLLSTSGLKPSSYDSLISEFYNGQGNLILNSSKDEIKAALLIFFLEVEN